MKHLLNLPLNTHCKAAYIEYCMNDNDGYDDDDDNDDMHPR